jgi:hypothetical protein
MESERFAPEYWRQRAEELQKRSQALHDPDAKRILLQLAMMYSGMALRMTTREAERSGAARRS